MFVIDAPIAGSGKSLLADIVALVATGRRAAVIAQGQDETEDEKRLSGLLMRGSPVINIDNAERPLAGQLLCQLLTQSEVDCRVLGQSTVLTLPTNAIVLATGNNLQLVGDLTRRALICRLDPKCERPAARSFNRDLREWIPTNRAALITAALTVLRAYHCAGRPKQKIQQYGSFERWSDLVRSALVWLGAPDPCETQKRLEKLDPVKSGLVLLLQEWYRFYGTEQYSVRRVVNDTLKPAALLDALLDVTADRTGEYVDARRLAHYLKKFAGRIESGLKFERGAMDGHGQCPMWRVTLAVGV
jgi:putative DNA primase/helicase